MSRTFIPNVREKLADLLDTKEFRTSADIIDAFACAYPEDWKSLVQKYGDREDAPGTGARGRYYAASTYVADRLSDMKRMGIVELKHTLDFDQQRWQHTRRMGSWRLLLKNRAAVATHGATRILTVRMPTDLFERIGTEAKKTGTTATALVIDALRRALQG